MTDALSELIQQYRSKGILVDTNVLLLYVVGSFDLPQVTRFKRTRQYTESDFLLLGNLLSKFRKILTTSNILTEVNSLAGQLGGPAKTACFEEFARRIALLDEHYVPSAEASSVAGFTRLGLTDCGIAHFAKDRCLVLTDDLPLYVYLAHAGVDVINFSHIRVIS